MCFCNHKYGEVKGNYQYCTKCGKAIVAPKVECNHIWVKEGEYEAGNMLGASFNAVLTTYHCKCCGIIKTVRAGRTTEITIG